MSAVSEHRRPSPGSNEEILRVFEATREKVVQSTNADGDKDMLGEITRVGINIVANGINCQTIDDVILSDKERPGNCITWYS